MKLPDAIKGLTVYKEPRPEKVFELLEDENEANDWEGEKGASPEANSQQVKEEKAKGKTPIKAEEWNSSREKKNKDQGQDDEHSKNTVTTELKKNLDRMKKEFNVPANRGIIIRKFKVARKTDAFILYVDGMADNNTINDFILKQLMAPEYFEDFEEGPVIDYITDSVLSVNKVSKENNYDKIIDHVLGGITAVFVDGCEECLIIENQGYVKRNIEKPITEDVVRGSQEGFNEDMLTNITLIRRIIRNKNLTVEVMPIDKTNKTSCAILYVKGIANPAVVNEAKKRIAGLNIDMIMGVAMIEELISDRALMPFSQSVTTERPDRASSQLMDGKVILIIDGTPFVSIIPKSIFEALHTPEDFSLNWHFAIFMRYLRVFALLTTMLLPGLYVSVVLFHQEMIPTELLNSIVKSRENVPFPTIAEIFFLEISFELIREGGIRVPGVIGNTLGIVGALILGQAAAQAQLVSPLIIIIIAVSGISSFAIPSYILSFESRLFRFVFIFFGAIAGFYGISAAIVLLLGIACNIKSFGVPFLSPIAPKTRANPDVISTLPTYNQKIRPDYINPENKYKAGRVTREWLNGKDGNKN